MDRAKNLERHLIGRAAEAAAADYFFVCGFSLVLANVRTGPLEVDLIVESGDLLVVVEVRSRKRGGLESGLESVRPRKREQVKRATAALWRSGLKNRTHIERIRFDVVTVSFCDSKVVLEHIESAFG